VCKRKKCKRPVYDGRLIFYLDLLIHRRYDKYCVETNIMTLDSEQLRAAMRAWTTGVTVVTATHNGVTHGMTVNSFTSISLEPALIAVSLQHDSRTRELVIKSSAFGLSILSTEQQDVSELFAGRANDSADRFSNIKTTTLITGAPLIEGGLAWMDCRVVHTYDGGTNTLFIGEVVSARSDGRGMPLIYHNRSYWNLSQS
jgi:flavin reductase (DIM6/NTAB) family NADH-FMN oxidoreductase RutF